MMTWTPLGTHAISYSPYSVSLGYRHRLMVGVHPRNLAKITPPPDDSTWYDGGVGSGAEVLREEFVTLCPSWMNGHGALSVSAPDVVDTATLTDAWHRQGQDEHR